jgi:hypothetical protein
VLEYLVQQFPNKVDDGCPACSLLEILLQKYCRRDTAIPFSEAVQFLEAILGPHPEALDDTHLTVALCGCYTIATLKYLFSKVPADMSSFRIKGRIAFLDLEKATVLSKIVPNLKSFGCYVDEWTAEGYQVIVEKLPAAASLVELDLPILPHLLTVCNVDQVIEKCRNLKKLVLHGGGQIYDNCFNACGTSIQKLPELRCLGLQSVTFSESAILTNFLSKRAIFHSYRIARSTEFGWRIVT